MTAMGCRGVRSAWCERSCSCRLGSSERLREINRLAACKTHTLLPGISAHARQRHELSAHTHQHPGIFAHSLLQFSSTAWWLMLTVNGQPACQSTAAQDATHLGVAMATTVETQRTAPPKGQGCRLRGSLPSLLPVLLVTPPSRQQTMPSA